MFQQVQHCHVSEAGLNIESVEKKEKKTGHSS